MDRRTREALALGGATGLLVALLARVVVVPEALAGVAVPLVLAGGVPPGFVAGATLSPDADVRPRRVGVAAGGVGGLALGGSLWLGMATVLTLPHATPIWWLAYLFAAFGPVTATSSALAGEFWPLAFAFCVLSVHAVGGGVGAGLAALHARRRNASGDERPRQ